eukprot:1134426-Pelagomonas_calceolata.AAC.4
MGVFVFNGMSGRGRVWAVQTESPTHPHPLILSIKQCAPCAYPGNVNGIVPIGLDWAPLDSV